MFQTARADRGAGENLPPSSSTSAPAAELISHPTKSISTEQCRRVDPLPPQPRKIDGFLSRVSRIAPQGFGSTLGDR